MIAKNLLIENLTSSIKAKEKLLIDEECLTLFDSAAELVLNTYKSGGQLFIAGNGGSAADAQHLAAEFVSRLAFDRNPLPAEALTVDSSILTAIGNDYGYDKIFSRQVEGKMTSNDVFLGITTTGNSPNITSALEVCNRLNIPSIIFCGKDGGKVKSLSNHCIIVPGEETATIQEVHIVLAHSLCGHIESSLFNKES